MWLLPLRIHDRLPRLWAYFMLLPFWPLKEFTMVGQRRNPFQQSFPKPLWA